DWSHARISEWPNVADLQLATPPRSGFAACALAHETMTNGPELEPGLFSRSLVMWFPSRLLSRSCRRRSRPAAPRSYYPWLELLETRDLPSGTSAATEQLQAAYGQLPLSFEANQGQTDPQVRFLSRGSGYALFLTPTEAVLTLQKPSAPTSAQPPA